MLTLQFIPYNEIETLTQNERVKKILGIVIQNKIVILEGRLKPVEEAALIQKTMENVSKNFKGVELCTIDPDMKKKKQQMSVALKDMMAKFLIGYRRGLTVIGPASIIKEIKRDPTKIDLLLTDTSKRRR